MTNANKGKLFCCFADFQKAVDSIWHDGLVHKLLYKNIGGQFYNLISDMYSKTKCAVKNGNKRSSFFNYNRGVRQGYILSPLCTGQFQTAHLPPPPGKPPGHLTFFKNFGQIPRYVASLQGQMPHPLELQRGSNPPPSRHVTHEINEYKQNRLPLETNSAKFSATTNFLFSLSSLHTLNKGIFHDISI